MLKTTLAMLAIAALFGTSACANSDPLSPSHRVAPSFQNAPASGNGQKEVIPVDLDIPDFLTCPSGERLNLHVGGWIQLWVPNSPNDRNLSLDAVNFVFTYTNSAGRAYVWHEVGNDQSYIDKDGNLVDVLTGRAGANGQIGRLVINTTTGEVTFVAGNTIETRDDQACAALT